MTVNLCHTLTKPIQNPSTRRGLRKYLNIFYILQIKAFLIYSLWPSETKSLKMANFHHAFFRYKNIWCARLEQRLLPLPASATVGPSGHTDKGYDAMEGITSL